jgi:hypothetical protein
VNPFNQPSQAATQQHTCRDIGGDEEREIGDDALPRQSQPLGVGRQQQEQGPHDDGNGQGVTSPQSPQPDKWQEQPDPERQIAGQFSHGVGRLPGSRGLRAACYLVAQNCNQGAANHIEQPGQEQQQRAYAGPEELPEC